MGSARSFLARLRSIAAHFTEHALRHGVVISIAVGVLTACADLAPTKARAVEGVLLADASCQGLTAEQCAALASAINDLLFSADAFCRSLGSYIESRFYNNEIVFDPNTSHYGYVNPGEPIIYLGSWAYSPGELANTLAHEESHISLGFEDLYNGAANDASAAGDRCAGPI